MRTSSGLRIEIDACVPESRRCLPAFFWLIDSTVLEIYYLVNIGLFTVAMSFLV